MKNGRDQMDSVTSVRQRVHTLAGLLTGVFAAVELAKKSETRDLQECLDNASTMIQQAQDELRELRSILQTNLPGDHVPPGMAD